MDDLNAATMGSFGETITLSTLGGINDPVTLNTVWKDDEGQMPKGIRATAWVLASDLSGSLLAKNDLVRRGDFTYRVVDPPNGGIISQRDGNGGIILYLRQVNHIASNT